MGMVCYLLKASNEELSAYVNDSSALVERLMIHPDARKDNIDKSWEGIQFILTGCATYDLDKAAAPLKWLIFGDYGIDENLDLGYGPARCSTAEQVKEIAEALNAISTAEFEKMYSHACTVWDTDMYPAGFRPDDTYFPSFYSVFETLKQFYTEAATNEEAVITFLG